MYETNAIGIDLSHYDHFVADSIYESADFVILKAGGSEDVRGPYADARLTERVQAAYDHGKPVGAYWFVGPRFWLEKQQTFQGIEAMSDDKHPLLQFILSTLKNKAIDFLAFDVEKASMFTSGGTVTGSWMAFYIRDLVERMQRQQRIGNMRPMKLGVYSTRAFIDEKAKDVEYYLGAQPDLFVWPANWPLGQSEVTTFADVKANHRPTHSPRSFGWNAEREKKMGNWQFWQAYGDSGRVFSSHELQNDRKMPRAMDIDVFNGTPAKLKEWLGYQVPKPPDDKPDDPLPPPTDLTALAARVAAIEAKLASVKGAL